MYCKLKFLLNNLWSKTFITFLDNWYFCISSCWHSSVNKTPLKFLCIKVIKFPTCSAPCFDAECAVFTSTHYYHNCYKQVLHFTSEFSWSPHLDSEMLLWFNVDHQSMQKFYILNVKRHWLNGTQSSYGFSVLRGSPIIHVRTLYL